MEQTSSLLAKSNPLRKGLRWEWVGIQGVIAVAIGLYALLAEESARRNIVLGIGIFLLINGIGTAIGGIRRTGIENTIVEYRMIGSGMGIATGLLVICNRIWDFWDIKSDRIVLGVGLLGVGLVVLIGLIVLMDRSNFSLPTLGMPLLLALWGAASIYQASNDTNSNRLIGWAALLIGVLLLGLAYMRRQSALSASATAA